MGKGKSRGNRKKTTRSHTTAIPEVERLLKVLHSLDEVTKISLGVIKPGLRAAPRRIKVRIMNAKVTFIQVRGVTAVQEVRVYSTDQGAVSREIARFSNRRRWKHTRENSVSKSKQEKRVP